MSREALHESLSAVMDDEADELELRRVLAASGDVEVRAAWSRLQIARAAMHNELVDPRLDLVSAVSAAIAEDEVPSPAAEQPKRRRWAGLSKLAVAASVTVAVLAGVRLYNQSEVGGPQMASQTPVQQVQPVTTPQAKSPAVLAGFSDNQPQPEKAAREDAEEASWHQKRLPDYLKQHSQAPAFSEQNGTSARPSDAEAR